MGYKQPRVPPMKGDMQLTGYIRELVLFLKDFCLESWMESRRMSEEIAEIKMRLEEKGTETRG